MSNQTSFCGSDTIQNASIYKKDSASPTMILFGTMGNQEPVAAKVFTLIDRETLTKVQPYLSTKNKNYLDFYIRAMQGLLYECKVYEKVGSLVAKEVTPNFITMYAVQKCDYNFIAAMVKKPILQVFRQLQLSMVLGVSLMKKLPVQILVTRRPAKSYTFEKFLTLREVNYADILNLIFQVIYTLKAMTLVGIQHQDLHLHNILVEEIKSPINLVYEVDEKTRFQIPTKYIARIFDWDTSYVKSLGKNNFLIPKDCLKYGQCNTFNSKFDLFLFLCRLSMMCSWDSDQTMPSVNKTPMCQTFLLDVLKEPGVTDASVLYDNIKKYFYRNQNDKGFYCFLREKIPSDVMKDHLAILKSPIFFHLQVRQEKEKEFDNHNFFYSLRKI